MNIEVILHDSGELLPILLDDEGMPIYLCLMSLFSRNDPSQNMSELTVSFGLKVRETRKIKKLSQEKLALLCNIDRSYMGRIERGEVNITLEKIYEIARALEINVKELLL